MQKNKPVTVQISDEMIVSKRMPDRIAKMAAYLGLLGMREYNMFEKWIQCNKFPRYERKRKMSSNLMK